MDTKIKGPGTLPRLRTAKGMTQRQLAKEAGISQSTLALIERGHRKAYLLTLSKLAAALEVDVDVLMEYLETTAPERGKLGQAVKKEKQKRD